MNKFLIIFWQSIGLCVLPTGRINTLVVHDDTYILYDYQPLNNWFLTLYQIHQDEDALNVWIMAETDCNDRYTPWVYFSKWKMNGLTHCLLIWTLWGPQKVFVWTGSHVKCSGLNIIILYFIDANMHTTINTIHVCKSY